jgi:hypothetical protein
MTHYASKELIDRAAACMSDFLDSRISDSPIVLLSDLAKSEPLLTNAEREEAILRWLREAKVWLQDSSIGQPGYWVGEEHLEQAAILFRGGHASDPVPEQRPSSALLEAARTLIAWFDDTVPWVHDNINAMRQAIEDEEARGPSEVEQLREQLRQRGAALDSWVHKSESEIEQLRKERDEALARAEQAEASADDKLRKLRGEVSSLRVIAMNTDPTSYTQAQRSQLAGRIAAYSQCISEVDRLLANPPSDVASVDSGDNPTLDAVCAVLGADVDSVEAQSAMLIEQARRVRPLEIAALDAMGWLRARLAESIGSSAVRDSIVECVDRIWSLVSDGAKERWPCHPPGVESPVESVDVVDDCDEHELPKDPPPSPPA